MIKLKDLKNRIYTGKACIRFAYEFVANEKQIIAYFDRNTENQAEWNMQIIFGRTRDKDSEVYNFGYIMPRNNLPLEVIAATGLKYFQLYIKEEVQNKSNIDFELGTILQGM